MSFSPWGPWRSHSAGRVPRPLRTSIRGRPAPLRARDGAVPAAGGRSGRAAGRTPSARSGRTAAGSSSARARRGGRRVVPSKRVVLVVSAGEERRAIWTSSKPARRTSCGTRWPSAVSVFKRRAANTSFSQTKASGRGRRAITRRISSTSSGSASTTFEGRHRSPFARTAFRTPSARFRTLCTQFARRRKWIAFAPQSMRCAASRSPAPTLSIDTRS